MHPSVFSSNWGKMCGIGGSKVETKRGSYQGQIHAKHLNPKWQICSIFQNQLVAIIKLFGKACVREASVCKLKHGPITKKAT